MCSLFSSSSLTLRVCFDKGFINIIRNSFVNNLILYSHWNYNYRFLLEPSWTFFIWLSSHLDCVEKQNSVPMLGRRRVPGDHGGAWVDCLCHKISRRSGGNILEQKLSINIWKGINFCNFRMLYKWCTRRYLFDFFSAVYRVIYKKNLNNHY